MYLLWAPPPLVAPIVTSLGVERPKLSPLILLWDKAGKVGMFFVIPSARIAQMRGKTPGQKLASFSTLKLKAFLDLQLHLKSLPTFFPLNKCSLKYEFKLSLFLVSCNKKQSQQHKTNYSQVRF